MTFKSTRRPCNWSDIIESIKNEIEDIILIWIENQSTVSFVTCEWRESEKCREVNERILEDDERYSSENVRREIGNMYACTYNYSKYLRSHSLCEMIEYVEKYMTWISRSDYRV